MIKYLRFTIYIYKLISMRDKIADVSKKINAFQIKDLNELEAFRIHFLGSKSDIKLLFGQLKSVANDDKKSIGKALNDLRLQAEEKFLNYKSLLESTNLENESIDFSKTGESFSVGSHHPISLVRSEIIEIFNRIGFVVSEGPEI